MSITDYKPTSIPVNATAQEAQNIDQKISDVEDAATANGYNGIYLPNWTYDFLVMLNVISLPFGVLWLTVAEPLGLPGQTEVPIVCGALYVFLLVLVKFF